MKRLSFHINILVWPVAAVVVFSCGIPELSPGDYNQWVENADHDLKQEREINNIGYRLQYKPYDYILNQEGLSGDARQKRAAELTGLRYFQLTIYPVKKGGGDLLKTHVATQAEHQQALYYYSYRFNEQLYLLEGADTLGCELYHFVRDHGLSPELRFVFGFSDSGKKTDRTVVVHDLFFENGLIKFNYEQQLIDKIPTINLNQI